MTTIQLPLAAHSSPVAPFKTQLLKWIGNKQRFAHLIASTFPNYSGTYFEPFLGSGAVLGTLAPRCGVGADAFSPLIGIWQQLKKDPDVLIAWYRERWDLAQSDPDPVSIYEEIKASYNASPNSADLLYLARACYGGVVRFRKADGYMSTPCGAHRPISPSSFADRVAIWAQRTSGSEFVAADFRETLARAKKGDVVYCDPPYVDTQAILYGAQAFRLADLLESIEAAKLRGAFVALSIDGSKRSGRHQVDLAIPEGLFRREVPVIVGRSMLRRFQLEGETLENEVVADRLLLTH